MYNRQLHNKTYYEKNKENIKRKQREKRQKMKEALQQLEAENQETENEPKPETMSSKFFLNISDNVKSILLKTAISGSLVASQAIYRALKKTIENKQSTTPSAPVISSNPLD
jgi:hypothetical protein